MIEKHFQLTGLDGQAFACTQWLPDGPLSNARATLQIAHGMGEHRLRYQGLAEALTGQGYAVYASDHRGHGDTRVAAGASDTRGSHVEAEGFYIEAEGSYVEAEGSYIEAEGSYVEAEGSYVEAEGSGAMGKGGWRQTLSDMNYLAEIASTQHPAKPPVLLGHSMGAALSQQYIGLYGATLSAAVLSGSPGFMGLAQLLFAQIVARLEALRIGPDTPSDLLQGLLFGKNNAAFATAGSNSGATPVSQDDLTGYEWLSKDRVEVEAYVADPKCGFVLTPRSLAEMFAGMRSARSVDRVLAIPNELPIYVFSGADDPVHAEESGLNAMLSCYRSTGLQVDYKLYPAGRHEMLNETNRVEVVADLISWLDSTLNDAEK